MGGLKINGEELNYECDSCGACCCSFPIFVSEADAKREPRIEKEGRALPQHLTQPGWDYQLFPLPFLKHCPFLAEDKLCKVYETRPSPCRAFTAGTAQCQEARVRHGIAPLLPEGS